MKTLFVNLFWLLFIINFSISAMVIHDHCEDKDKTIKIENGIFNEDYLFLGNELNFSGKANELTFLGKRLTFTGNTKLGIHAICETMTFSGSSGNGIIAAGMDMIIDGTITGNNYVACKSLTVSDKGVINGNIFIACATITLEGKLNGDLFAGGAKIVINNEIKGNVFVQGGRIIIGEKGKILGNLSYTSKEKLSESELARISGTKNITVPKQFYKDWDIPTRFKNSKSIPYIIGLCLFISYVSIACILLFIPVFKKLDNTQSQKKFWNNSLWGIIPVLMYPAIILICFIMIITIPLAIILLLLFIPLFFIANIIGTTLIGKFAVKKFNWKIKNRHSQFLIGLATCSILTMIPIVNFLVFLFVSALGWGTFVSFLFQKDLSVKESIATKSM